MAKIKIAVAGCLGRMGQEISKQILQNKNLEFVGGFEHKKHKDINKPLNKVSSIHSAKLVTANAAQLIKDSNVIIDFTTPESTLDNLKIASANKTAVVIGTTGMTDAQKKKVKSYSKKIPILMSSNMSLGVNLLFNLVKQTASALKDTDYDIEIAETHHKHKKDAPSGTAKDLAKFIDKFLDLNTKTKINFIRDESSVGIHEIKISLDDDELILTHNAYDRKIFAKGAIKAIEWISSQKPGLYSMQDISF